MTVCSEFGAERRFAAGAIEVITARLEAPPATVRALAGRLCPMEHSRAARFRFDCNRRRYVVARARLRELLAARLGVPAEEVEFSYGRNGKPALSQRFAYTGWRFNVSHCDDVAVYAFSRAYEVGIDIEAIRALREADEIAARFFSPRENKAYRAVPAPDKSLAFAACWTRKEAFVKALGEGLRVPLDRFDVCLAPGGASGWIFESFSPLPGFIAALAARPA
jgi:4'-phosphopantetheinyl transferase